MLLSIVPPTVCCFVGTCNATGFDYAKTKEESLYFCFLLFVDCCGKLLDFVDVEMTSSIGD